MTFSEYSGTAFIPTLARLVLAGVFITAGFHKCFKDKVYSPEEAATLQKLEFKLTTPESDASAMRTGVNPIEIVPASFVQDGGDAGGDTQDPPPTGTQDTGGADDQDTGGAGGDEVVGNQDTGGADDEVVTGQDAAELVPPVDVPVVTGPMSGRQAGDIAILLDKEGWPQPKLMAWVASLTEFVGGILLLVGLFSRLWGAGLAITMAVAFYFTSWGPLSDAGFKLFSMFENNPAGFSSMFLQLSLMVLAMLVLFAGPGPLSIDRLLFGKPATEPEEGL